MKYIFIFLILFHGLIHFLGFVKAFQIVDLNQLQSTISKPIGVLWLIAAILFLFAVILLFICDYWFISAAAGAFISSCLIMSVWSDARFGMIPNIIILIVCFYLVASFSYKSVYLKDIELATKANSYVKNTNLTESDIQNLPIPVQKYIRLSGSVGKPKVLHFKALFHGKIRKNNQSEWMIFKCEQHNFIETSTRLFFMDALMKRLPVAGYHHCKNGKAVMDIRLLSLIKVQYAEGKEMDISETVTFFNDMCFIAPATLIDSRIKWIETNGNAVKCSFSNNNITIHAILSFNRKGELINFISNDRFVYVEKGTMARIPWQTPIKAYKSVNGYYLPAKAELIYNYDEGDLCYGEFNLGQIEYN
jgi:hypothetical protein